MNTNFVTIDNMLFAGANLASPITSNSTPLSNSYQISPEADTANLASNATESKTADNISDITQDVTVNKPTQDFNNTLRKAVKKQEPQQNQETNKSTEQNPVSEAHTKAEPEQSEPTQEVPYTLEVLVKENNAKIEPKTSSQLTQFMTNLKDSKPQKNSKSLLTEKTEKSAETKLPVITNNKQILPKTVISNSSLNLEKIQKNLSDISKNTPISDKKTINDQDNNTTQVSNETIVNTKILPNVQTTKEKEPVSETFVENNSNKTAANEKPPILDTSIVTNKTQSSKPINKQFDSDTLKVVESKTEKENSALIDKPVIQTNEKTLVSSTSFSEIQNSQSNGIIPEKSILNTNKAPENTSDSKTTEPETILESPNSENKEALNSENKLSDNNTAGKLNILDIQVSTGQTKNNTNTASNNNSELEQIIAQNNPQTPSTEQSPGSVETAKNLDIPAQTSPANPTADASKQVIESIQSSYSQQQRNQQITVQLNPPELGKVSIKFQEQDEQITGLLEVSKTQTRVEIEQAIPQILRDLQNSGIQIKRLDVVLTQEHDEQPGQEALRDQTMQNGFTRQQQGSSDSYTESNNPEADEINKWLINNNRYRNISELQESLYANDSINMLA